MTPYKEHKLEEVASITSGFAFKSELFSKSGGLPLIRIRDVQNGSSKTFYNGPYSKNYVVNDGDMLVSMDGEFYTAIWRGGKALLNQRVCRINPNKSKIDEKYLFYFLPKALKRIEEVTPFVTVKHLSTKTIHSIIIPLPPLSEQRRIAAILDKADALRRKRAKTLNLLDQFLRAVFLDMFGDPVRNEKKWPVARLDKVALIGSGITKGKKYGDKITIEVPYIRVANVQAGYLDMTEIKTIRVSKDEIDNCTLKLGDVLMTEGGDWDKLGRGALWNGQIDPCVHQNHIFRVRCDKTTLLPEFLEILLQTPYAKKYFQRAAKQTTNLATINKTQLSAFPVLKPPINLQNQFVRAREKMKLLKIKAESENAQMSHLFNSLTQRAFQGGI